MRYAFGALAVILAAVFASSTTGQAPTTAPTIVHISDFHYDPLYGTPLAAGSKCSSTSIYGAPGCDSPLTVAQSAIANAVQNTSTGILIATGDWLRHDMTNLANSSAVAKQVFAQLTAAFRKYGAGVVPHPAVEPELGNEDFIPDYGFNFTQQPNTLLQMITRHFVRGGFMSTAEASTFGVCGYYARNVTNTSLTLVMLNTVLWSSNLNPATKATDPCGQFKFLVKSLIIARAAGRRVYIVAHIPPTFIFWMPQFSAQYISLMQSYNDIVAAQLFGHTHTFSFAPMTQNNTAPPLFIAGSITQITNSNPSYDILTVDPISWTVLDIRQRFMTPNTLTWVDGASLLNTLGLTALTNAQLYPSTVAMQTNDTLFNGFYTMYRGGFVNSKASCGFWDLCAGAVLCTMTTFSRAQYDVCMKG